MAYNNIFPMTYQPQQMYYPQMQNQGQQTPNGNSLIWVSGEYVNGTVDDPTVVPTPLISVIDGSLSVNRIA